MSSPNGEHDVRWPCTVTYFVGLNHGDTKVPMDPEWATREIMQGVVPDLAGGVTVVPSDGRAGDERERGLLVIVGNIGASSHRRILDLIVERLHQREVGYAFGGPLLFHARG